MDRYIGSLFLKQLGFSSVFFVIFFLFEAIFSDLYDQPFPVKKILYFHFLNLAQVWVQMTPPAVLLATMMTVSQLVRNQEWVAFLSMGVSVRRLMRAVFVIVACVSAWILMMEDRILPPIYRQRLNYYWRDLHGRSDFYVDMKRDRVWYRSQNMIYNLKLFDQSSSVVHGMTLYTFDDQFDLIEAVTAERGEYAQGRWTLYDGIVTVMPKESAMERAQTPSAASGKDFPMSQSFQKKEVVIQETPQDFQEIEREVDTFGFRELWRYIQKMKLAGATTHAAEVKLHARFSLAFVPWVMCLMALPFSLSSRREGRLARNLGVCLGITFFYWLFYSTSLSLGVSGALPPWLAAWLPSILFVVLAATLMFRRV